MAGNGYFLSSDDVRLLKDMARAYRAGKTSRRPTPQRRRNRGGGGSGGSPATYVQVFKTVPPLGRKQNAGYVKAFDDTPSVFGMVDLLIDPDGEVATDNFVKIGIYNWGYNPIVGSDDIWIPAMGFDIYTIYEVDEDDESPEPEETPHRYLVVTNFDLASLPGTELTTIDNEPQGPHKPDGGRLFYNDGGPCEVAE